MNTTLNKKVKMNSPYGGFSRGDHQSNAYIRINNGAVGTLIAPSFDGSFLVSWDEINIAIVVPGHWLEDFDETVIPQNN